MTNHSIFILIIIILISRARQEYLALVNKRLKYLSGNINLNNLKSIKYLVLIRIILLRDI